MGKLRRRHPEKLAWPPDWLPDRLLRPDQEPVITVDELLDGTPEDYAKLYYRRSGRFLWTAATREEAEKLDAYHYVRQLLKGKLPWESGKDTALDSG